MGSEDELRKYALNVQNRRRTVDQLVIVEAETADDARETFKDEFSAFEVGITTLPYDGETTEVVFSRTEEAAVKIAVGRKGEYSDVHRFVEDYDTELEVVDVTPADEVDGWEVEWAEDDYRTEQALNGGQRQEGSA